MTCLWTQNARNRSATLSLVSFLFTFAHCISGILARLSYQLRRTVFFPRFSSIKKKVLLYQLPIIGILILGKLLPTYKCYNIFKTDCLTFKPKKMRRIWFRLDSWVHSTRTHVEAFLWGGLRLHMTQRAEALCIAVVAIAPPPPVTDHIIALVAVLVGLYQMVQIVVSRSNYGFLSHRSPVTIDFSNYLSMTEKVPTLKQVACTRHFIN